MTTKYLMLEPWYGVRTLYLHPFSDENGLPIYEERIVIFHALDENEAIALAEAEAEQYAAANDCTVLEYIMCFHLTAAELVNAVEVFSLMRGSALEAREYIDRHFDTSSERARNVEEN